MAKRNRLHAICPYFAMFPEQFVQENVRKYSRKGDWVFDPFSGRGTTILQALLMGRRAAGMDINPVAYCISGAKANLPSLERTLRRIDELEAMYVQTDQWGLERKRRSLPEFFGRAFHHGTMRSLLFLRSQLKWQDGKVDRFIAALVLGSLHGEMDKSSAYFSNQMPRTISLKPGYSLSYWRKHGLWPKKREVFEMLKEKAALRLEGNEGVARGRMRLEDARRAAASFRDLTKRVKLVVTSPPYLDITNFEEDQWLRLWFLGNDPEPTYRTISGDDRHRQARKYWGFLTEAWKGLSRLMAPGSVIVCRIGGKGLAVAELTDRMEKSLKAIFPCGQFLRRPFVSRLKNRQTQSFAPDASGCLFEVDYTFATSPQGS
jgi:hypothetical protein